MFSTAVAKALGYYVYVYCDPESGEVFYVGKGRDNRAFVHLKKDPDEDSDLVRRINDLRARGRKPKIEILLHGLADEETAYRVECAAIDLLGKENLANAVRGWRSGINGRMTCDQVRAIYEREPVELLDPILLIRINRLFRYGLSPVELYDATRGVWRVGERRHGAELALAVYDGVVQEVYRIRAWFPAGSTFSTRGALDADGRWEFVGSVAEESARSRYLNKSVSAYFAQGSQQPVRYVNVPE